MANVLKRDKQVAILRCLVEGNSIRSTERLTGVHRDTIMRTLVRFGGACEGYLDHAFRDVRVGHVQVDEIWTFVRKKQARLIGREQNDPTIGDIYLFTALDTDSKALISYTLGKRSYQTTSTFVRDLESRLARRPVQISSDGWTAYQTTIADNFGHTASHGVLVKKYTQPESGRYQPPPLVDAERVNIRGISDLMTICTSHVERCNLTIRTFLKRFTRLALGFSKKLENLSAAVALHFANYNFCWQMRENGASGKLRCTPAMQAGLATTLWSFDDLFNRVTEWDAEQKRMAKYRRFADRLRGE